MKKTRISQEDRLDCLDLSCDSLQFQIVRCCYLIQQIKCLVRNGRDR